MIERNKVIEWLDFCIRNTDGSICNCEMSGCPYLGGSDVGNCFVTLMTDALALLKAQEPRVVTLAEIPDAVFGWIEMFGQLIPCVLEDVYADDTVGFANIEDGHDYLCASDYNKTWRCWSQRPTDEQREAVKWELPTTKRP